MAEALEDLPVVHSQSSGAPRKRARQDSACTTENNLGLVNGGGGTGSSSSHSSDDGLDGNNRESGRHKRQRGEGHADAVLSRTPGQWSLSTSSRSGSLSPASNATQLSEHSESTAFSTDDFISLSTSHNQDGPQEPQRAVNEYNSAEENIARSMEFDQEIEVLRRSPDSLASHNGLPRLSNDSRNLEISQSQSSINPTLSISSGELSHSTHEGNTLHGDARSELVPRLLRRMHLRSNESSGSNLSSVETDDMGSSSSSLFRLGSLNRVSHPVPNPRSRSLANTETVPTNSTNPWIPYEDERETLPSLFQTNSARPSSHDRAQLPSLSHAIHARNGPRNSSVNRDPIVSSSRTSTAARSDPPSLSSRHNPTPLRSSDWFQDMHDLFHPYTPFAFDDNSSSADSGRESPLPVNNTPQSRHSPNTDIRNTLTSTTNHMEGIERTFPSSSSFRNRSSTLPLEDTLRGNIRPEDNGIGSGSTEPAARNTSPLRRSASERNGPRGFSPVPWRNFLAGLDSRESSLENLTGPLSNIVPERQQATNQGQSTSLVGTLRDLLHRSTTTTQGESAPPNNNRRSILRNPFRSSEQTRSRSSLDTEERLSGLIDDDYPVLLMPPDSTTPVTRPSRSLLDPALRFNSIHSSAPSAEHVRPPASRLRRSLRISWAMDDEAPSREPEPFIPEPMRNERIEPRPRSISSIFGINRSPTTSDPTPSSVSRAEPSWPQTHRNTSDSRSPVHSPQYLPGHYLRRSPASERLTEDNGQTFGLSGLSASRRELVQSPTNGDSRQRSISPIYTPGEPAPPSESYLSRLHRHLRRLPTGNSQRNGQLDPLISESNVRTSNPAGMNVRSHEPWISHGTINDSHRDSINNSRPLSPDFLFSRRMQVASDNPTRQNHIPYTSNRFIPPSTLRDSSIGGETNHHSPNDVNGIGSDVHRPWRIPPVRNGESFNDLVRRRAARADAMLREAQSRTYPRGDQRVSSMSDLGFIGQQRSSLEQLRAERLTRLERLRSSLEGTTAAGGEAPTSSQPEGERESSGHTAFMPRLSTDRPLLPRSVSGTWSNDTPHWNDLPRLPSLGRIPPPSYTAPFEPPDALFANPMASRTFANPNTTSAEDDTSASISRDRQQLRDIISRRTRDEEFAPRGFLSRHDRFSGQPDPLAPFTDATARLQRRLRESEAEVDRALRALDQWGDLEQRDIEPAQSYMHRFGERRRRLSFFNITPTSDWTATTLGSLQAQQDQRPERRSPSPTTLSVRQQARQARFARAQSRYREGSDLFGERRPRSRFELRGYLPRTLGDYIADEDFDSSYENLLQLSSLIGDVKPRGTAPHLLAKMPTGFYKDFAEPDGETRCPICLDDYKDLDPVLRISDCNHWFHKGCLEQWLQNARTCPLCKTVVKGREQGKKSADDAPGPSRRDDDSDNDDTRYDRREDSPSLTLEELGSYAAGW